MLPSRSSLDRNYLQLSEMTSAVVVSPHYDDAVFSCGSLLSILPSCTVMTVYTGLPQDKDVLTDWDQRCGFSSAGEAMQARLIENEHALSALRLNGIDLGFLDSQYIKEPREATGLFADTVTANIERLKPSAVFCPLGLFHEDHIYVSEVFMTIRNRFPAIHWFMYEDIPYRNEPQRARRRLSELIGRGWAVEPFPVELPAMYKAKAVDAYQSQFRGLGYKDGLPILQQQEKYWRLHCKPEMQ